MNNKYKNDFDVCMIKQNFIKICLSNLVNTCDKEKYQYIKIFENKCIHQTTLAQNFYNKMNLQVLA